MRACSKRTLGDAVYHDCPQRQRAEARKGANSPEQSKTPAPSSTVAKDLAI